MEHKKQPHISIPHKAIEEFCHLNHIKKLSLFGSVLTENFRNSSDVDFLVQFDKQNIPTLISLSRMESELSDIIGRKADLRTAEDLSPYFREQVVRESYFVYEQ